MSIFITGDTHGDPRRLGKTNFAQSSSLTKEDYVIILGDFGLVWNKDNESKYEKHWLDWLDSRNFTTLFIDGNHENYDRLNAYPVEWWKGGKVQRIRPSVIHLMRGEIFNIDEKIIFAMGGASSHDIRDGILEIDDARTKTWKKDLTKMFRINHLSWWKEEIPNQDERNNAIKNLAKHNYKVDFVLSHEAPASDVAILGLGYYKPDKYSQWLEKIRYSIDYKKWFFGHYHDDRYITSNEILVYENIIQIA